MIKRQRILSIALVGLLSFGGSFLLANVRGMPVPYLQDEFSYLLASDTFAHGRITNPPHPLWEHFETFQVLQQPTYMSAYPPGQGFFMAIGQVLFGHPVYGVWLSAALMCMAICWMLYAWLPARWALIGGLVGVLQFGVFTYWSQSYWGGAVAGLGGALVFGALPRIFRYRRLRDTLWLGLGIFILANSRPIEGILIGIPVGCLLLPWNIKWERARNAVVAKNVLLPFILLLLLTIACIGTYNEAVTGNAFEFPHLLYYRTYSVVPFFIWQNLSPTPDFHHSIMHAVDDFYKHYYNFKRTWDGFIIYTKRDLAAASKFYFWFPLAIPSIFIILKLLCRWQWALRLSLAAVIILLDCAVSTCTIKAHYFSSLTCVAVLLLVAGLRALSSVRISRIRVGVLLAIFLFLYQLNVNVAANMHPFRALSFCKSAEDTTDAPGFLTREEFKEFLFKKGGKHLVIVRYRPDQSLWNEWVFNDADIDHAPIVWARDMGAEGNAKLLEYYKGRQVWQIIVGWEQPFLPKYDWR